MNWKTVGVLWLLWVLCPCIPTFGQKPAPKNLIFEGAGIRGIAYAGVLKQLEILGYVNGIEKVGGTSAGAISALLVSLGYTSEEAYDIISSTNFNKFNQGGIPVFGGLHRMHKRYGWYKADRFEDWLAELIEQKTGNPEITFTELRDQGFKRLFVTGTCLNRQEMLVFSDETYPHMKVKDAVRISMSIPFYFEAVLIDSIGRICTKSKGHQSLDLVVDGGFISNFPISIFDSFTLDSMGNSRRIANPFTLGIRIDTDAQIVQDIHHPKLAGREVNNLGEYFEAFGVIVLESLNRSLLTPDDWKRTISVSSTGIGPKLKKLSDGQKAALMESGLASTWQYFTP